MVDNLDMEEEDMDYMLIMEEVDKVVMVDKVIIIRVGNLVVDKDKIIEELTLEAIKEDIEELVIVVVDTNNRIYIFYKLLKCHLRKRYNSKCYVI